MGMANMRYIFHVASKVSLYGLFLLDDAPVVWNSTPHMNKPYNFLKSMQEWVHDIRPFQGLGAIAAELRDRNLDGSRIGLVGYTSTIQTVPTLLAGEVEALRKALPHAELADAGALLEQMRLVKSPEEIGMLRRAAAIGRTVVNTMVEKAQPGVTEAELFAEMIRTQIANGGEPNIFNLLASGPVEHPSDELWHLLHGLDQPQAPSMRPLKEGDIVISEWHSKYGGYLAHTEYTVYVGTSAPAQLHDIFKVCVECLDASREHFKVGNTLRNVWEACRRPCERAGYGFVELGFHAMGLGSPEFPTVIYASGEGPPALNGSRIGDLVLEDGMTFGNNLDIYNPKWKLDVGCMLSDFMVVREREGELLVNTPRVLGESGKYK
jgi:Xaa-Pro aminopeptidase